jgi:hypothetical protein
MVLLPSITPGLKGPEVSLGLLRQWSMFDDAIAEGVDELALL